MQGPLLFLLALRCSLAPAGIAFPSGPPEESDSQRQVAHWEAAGVTGTGFLVVGPQELAWTASRGKGGEHGAGEVLSPTPLARSERMVLTYTGPGRARIVQQPTLANGHTTIVEAPVPGLSWDQGDVWDCDQRPPEPISIQLHRVPFAEWSAAQWVPGELEEEQRAALRAMQPGRGEGDPWLWDRIALLAENPELRERARDCYLELHRHTKRVRTAADERKLTGLRAESVRAFYGEPGEALLGEHVMLLWPPGVLAHPSVPGFLAQLDSAYAALVDLTGHNPSEERGGRLCFFLMQAGAAYFDHHVGMGREEFGDYPPLDSVYLHEMGHDFFVHRHGVPIPEGPWGEGFASFAQARALEHLGFAHEGLFHLWKEGELRIRRHREQGGELAGQGVYFMGATSILSLGRREEAGQWSYDWDAFGHWCRRLRALESTPRSPRDRYRHWAGISADVFGPQALTWLSEIGFPVDPQAVSSTRFEQEHVLPRLRTANASLRSGDPDAAAADLRELGRAESGLKGEVAEALTRALLAAGESEAAQATADQLGFLRHWWIHMSPSSGEGSGSGIESALGGALQSVTLWDRPGGQAQRTLGPSGFVPVLPPQEQGFAYTAVDPLGLVDLKALAADRASTGDFALALTWIDTVDGGTFDLRLGHDDDLRVFLNGDPIARRDSWSTVSFDEAWIPLPLKPGRNSLLLRIRNRGGDWGFQARLAGSKGLAAPGASGLGPTPQEPQASATWIPLAHIGVPDGHFQDLHVMPRDGVWEDHCPQAVRVRIADPVAATAWSHIHPGPRDAWAGSQSHTFGLIVEDVDPTRTYRLLIWTVGQNGWTPPRLEVSSGSSTVAFELPGSPDAALGDPAQGTPCRLTVNLPPGVLQAGTNTIRLTIPRGSWVLYDALEWQARDERR